MTNAPTTIMLTTTAHPTLYQHPGPAGEPTHPGLGRLIQPRHTSSIEKTAAAGIVWAADNDCFQGLDETAYVRMLDRIAGLPGCLFVTVPDVVADADATAELFARWLPELRARDLPVALVAQNGLTIETTPWDELDALFIGGDDEFKLGPAAAELAREARRRGIWVHWGRVNSRKRFDLIRRTGAADSFDGSKWSRFRKTYLDQGLTWTIEPATGEMIELELEIAAPATLPAAELERRPATGIVRLANGRVARWHNETSAPAPDDELEPEPSRARALEIAGELAALLAA